jgi:uncharacterized heparinase superfamily protein
MFSWLDTMTHPDGDISFFNDATLGFAPNLNELKEYNQRIGENYSRDKFDKITHLQNSGYIRISNYNMISIIDVGLIGPDYLPGHAHADTLSFELSLFGQRLLVNSGTSEYEISSVRQYERSTEAHNTVTVNDKNSSEVWGSFRVARRAYPFDLKVEEQENFVSISCSHDGYKRIIGKTIHRRNWKFFENSLIIKDYVEGPFKSAFAYFHFHPSINISKKQNDEWDMYLPNGHKAILKVKANKSLIKKSYYASEFGKKLNTHCLKVALDKELGSLVKISWSNLNE